MRLEVVIASYNRELLLRKALKSLIVARRPEALRIRVTVVDNNSTENTRGVVEEFQDAAGGHLEVAYLLESRQGKSFALNTAIGASGADLIGLIDDDERVHVDWFHRIYHAFQDPAVEFVGGPCLPDWGSRVPVWLPPNLTGPIQVVDLGDRARPYDEWFPGILMGGNAVLRRGVFDRIGLYSTAISRRFDRLLSGEDEDLYRRLLVAGARGVYLPDLIIYHYIPPERLTKQYFRRWIFWHGVSSVRSIGGHRVPRLLGIPRWHFGVGARSLVDVFNGLLWRPVSAGKYFESQLNLVHLIGLLYGRWLFWGGTRSKNGDG